MADAPAAAAAEHLQPLGSKGQSVSWKRYKANALSIAWQMLQMMRQEQHPHLTKHPLPHNAAKFLDQTKAALLDPLTYELLATYISTVHKKANDDFLTATTAKNYLNSVLQSAFDHCKTTWGPASADTLLFFGCLDPRGTTEGAKWLQVLRPTASQPKRVDLLHTRALPLPEVRAGHEICVDFFSTPPRLRMQGLCHSIYNNMQV